MKFTVDKNDCWNWTGTLNDDGYAKIKYKDKTVLAHRLMAHITIKALKLDTEVVAHRCDNRRCINPNHLFITTSAGNTKDRDEKGRGAIGEKHPHSKLTVEKVLSIRAQHQDGVSLAKIAPQFGVSIATIYAVVRREVWKHVH